MRLSRIQQACGETAKTHDKVIKDMRVDQVGLILRSGN